MSAVTVASSSAGLGRPSTEKASSTGRREVIVRILVARASELSHGDRVTDSTASVSAWRAVDDVVTSRPPNCGMTPVGARRGCAVAPPSSTP
jgi:hypothetical protein